MLRDHGVHIPDDVRFFASERTDKLMPDDAYAIYSVVNAHGRYGWADFAGAKDGRGEVYVPVKVKTSVLESDEAILAIFGHELHELRELRRIFQDRETIPGEEACALLCTGKPGNLHDRAWDEADRLVNALRASKDSDNDA